MTATHSIAPTLLVAIDISKHRHEVLIGIPGKTRRRRLTVMNALEDFQRLSAILASYGLPTRIGFEATGNYHRPLAHHLGRAGFELKLVSSVGLARTREALHNSWDKNDPKDAQVILHMLEIGAVQHFHDPLAVGTADIQELSKTHEIVSRSKTELWHRILTHYLPLYFPEAERFHRSSRTDWFLAFLEKYPTPQMITAMSREGFIDDAWQVVGRKVSKERLLSDIYATAVASVGLPVHPDSDAVRMFRLVLAEGRSLIRQRDEIEARAVELLSDLPDYQLLTTIPGIGPINAMTILAEAGDLRRFRHHRQFLKFCGMDLATVQSGMFRGQSRISKYGNARLRRTLWMAGQTAVLKRTNSFRDKFERYISKDRHNAHLRRKPKALKPAHKPFKAYEPGYLHIDVKYLPQMAGEERRRYLFVAIDRATRWVFVRIYPAKTAANARRFLRDLDRAAPMKITRVLTDNGKEFTDRLFGLRKRAATGNHDFDRLCAELEIEHRLAPPMRPQTNGMVERFNGRIEDVLQSHHFRSGEELEQTILRYVRLYNGQLPQSVLKGRTPIATLKDWHRDKPELFKKRPYNHSGCDSLGL